MPVLSVQRLRCPVLVLPCSARRPVWPGVFWSVVRMLSGGGGRAGGTGRWCGTPEGRSPARSPWSEWRGLHGAGLCGARPEPRGGRRCGTHSPCVGLSPLTSSRCAISVRCARTSRMDSVGGGRGVRPGGRDVPCGHRGHASERSAGLRIAVVPACPRARVAVWQCGGVSSCDRLSALIRRARWAGRREAVGMGAPGSTPMGAESGRRRRFFLCVCTE